MNGCIFHLPNPEKNQEDPLRTQAGPASHSSASPGGLFKGPQVAAFRSRGADCHLLGNLLITPMTPSIPDSNPHSLPSTKSLKQRKQMHDNT